MAFSQDAATIQGFMLSIRRKTPPYNCYICQKTYRSLSGMEYHLKEVGHDENGKERSKNVNARPMNNTPKKGLTVTSRPKNKNRKSGGLKSGNTSSPAMAKKETLTYSEAQRLVQVDVDGALCRIAMSSDLDVVVNKQVKEAVDGDVGGKQEENNFVDVPSIDSEQICAPDSLPVTSADSTASASTANGNERDGGSSQPCADVIPSLSSENGDSVEGCRKVLRRSCVSKGKEGKDVPRPTEVLKKPRRTATSGACTSALPVAVVRIIEPPCRNTALQHKSAYFRFIEKSTEELDEVVEYDMDEEDSEWLEGINAKRKKEGIAAVSHATFEMLMDRFEKESFFESRRDGTNGLDPVLIDEDAVCCICNDGEAQNTNVILFCDMCNLAVHQECYGVPFIPEGQWLCRRCLNSPSCAVDCVLCPNKGGAFKQTENGQWAHVVCALWIPEVQFANTVFLEPIDSINEIPGARWRLTCYICHRRGGACIQCVSRNCYIAFHATCAQHAGLYMKIEMKKGGDVPSVRKVVYCDVHSTPSGEDPPDADPGATVGRAIIGKSASSPQSASNTLLHRKLQAERRMNAMSAPIVNIPFVPDKKLGDIASLINIPKKSVFVQQLRSFWALKRQSRSGVPLLRRLQASHQSQKSGLETETVAALKEQLVHWHRLRHDLERSRLLIELIRKREKLKREDLRMQQHMTDLELQPLTVLLRRTLDQLQQKDPVNIFAEPVSVVDVPDYPDIISHPMDFSTMRQKLENHEYLSVAEFAADFELIYRNCMTYNAKETVYFRAAIRLRDSSTPLLRFARRQAERAGIDPDTGMHVEHVVDPARLDQQLNEVGLTLAEQLEDLKDEIEDIKASSGPGKPARLRALRKQVTSIRRQMNKEIVETKLAAGVMTAEEAAMEVSDEPPPSSKLKKQMKRKRETSTGGTQSKRACASDMAVCETTADSWTEADDDESSAFGHRPSYSGSSRTLAVDPLLASPEVGARPQRNRKVSERMRETDDFALRCAAVTRTSSHDVPNELPVSPTSLSPIGPHTMSPVEGATAISSSDSLGNRAGRPVVSLPRLRQSPGGHQSTDAMPMDLEMEVSATAVATAAAVAASTDTSSLDNGHTECSTDGMLGPTHPSFSQPGHPVADDDMREEEFDEAGVIIDSPSGRRKRRMDRVDSLLQSPEKKSSSMSLFAEDRCKLSNGDSSMRAVSTDSVETDDIEVGGDGDNVENVMLEIELKPLDLVWAKSRGYPSYPALMIDPAMTAEEADIGGGIVLPLPPAAVLELHAAEADHLVLFFDARRTWQWLPRSKLAPLGSSSLVDESKLTECRKPATRRNVSKAFDRALMHRIRAATTPETTAEEA